MTAHRCPHCGQAIIVRARETRLGVELTPFKARIFDVVRRAGSDGIHADDLFGIIYADKPNGKYRALTWAIYCINRQIQSAGWRIAGHTTLKTWRLVPVRSKARAA